MHLHEYQAKELFTRYGIPVPKSQLVRHVEEIDLAARLIGGKAWVVKAQVHAGGRGKSGGVRRVDGLDALRKTVTSLLGSHLVTSQTGSAGLPVSAVLIEALTDIQQELYLSLLVDRSRRRIAVMTSNVGGMEIEAVALKNPDLVLTTHAHPAAGLQAWQGRLLGFKLGLSADQSRQFSKLLSPLYQLFIDIDATMIEINPLVVTAKGELLALDAKLNLDDNALYRHQDLAAWDDKTQAEPAEVAAQSHGLNYIRLDGDIGCMVNGAGLAMATMDLIKLSGGQPANFLDVGGAATASRVAEAFKLILSDSHIRALLVNIFGGIVRCDLIAEGVVQAIRDVSVNVPVVVRLEGTNAELGREVLNESGLNVLPATDLADAAKLAVSAAEGQL